MAHVSPATMKKNINRTRGITNMAVSQYCCRGTWGKMEDDRVGREELLVAGDDKGSDEVCGRM